MTATTKLALELLASQPGNQLQANTTFAQLNQLVMPAVVDKDLAAPPGSPANEALYIVAGSPTGAWAGKGGQLAYWLTSTNAWQFIVPRAGFEVRVLDEPDANGAAKTYSYTGSAWVEPEGGGGGGGSVIPADLTFTGTAARILADFTNATLASRTMFQSSTANSPTSVGAIPSGTGSVCNFSTFSSSDPDNSSIGQMAMVGGADFRINSYRSGSASALPMTFWTNNLERVRLTLSGDIGVGTATPAAGFELVREGVHADITATTYGVDGGGILHGRYARGTKASPTAVLSGDIFAGIGGRAYHAGGAFQSSSPTSIHWVASEDQGSSSYGSYLRILTTPKGSNTRVERLLVTDNGVTWCHGLGTFDPRIETQSKPFSDIQFLASASTANAAYGVVAYGTTVSAGYRGGASGGSAAAPSATQADQIINFMGGHVWSTSGWSTGTKALIGFHAAENSTDSAQGTYITLQTTPKGSVARAERVRVKPSGQVRFVPLSSAPTVDVEDGDVYFDSTLGKLRCRAGGVWNNLF